MTSWNVKTRRWFFNTNPRQIGLRYSLSIAAFLLAGLIAAALLQIELFTPARDFVSSSRFGGLLSMHGTVMVFVVLIPLLPGIIGNLILPQSVVSSKLALPRLNLVSWYLHLIGALLCIFALEIGSYDGGWAMRLPLPAAEKISSTALVGGLFCVALSSLFLNLSLAGTVISGRLRKIEWRRLPLVAWFFLFGSLVQIIVTPARLVTLVMLWTEQVGGIPFINAEAAQNLLLYERLFWIYAGPATFATILPAIGIGTEILAANSIASFLPKQRILAAGLVLTALSFFSWGMHFIASPDQTLITLAGGFYGVMSVVAAFYLIGVWLRLLARSRTFVHVSIIIIITQLLTLAISGATGISLATAGLGVHLHDTHFTVAHLHYAALGGALLSALAALFYWWPTIWPRPYSQIWARYGAVGLFVGVNLTFLPLAVIGAAGSPRAYVAYAERWGLWHVVSSIGSAILILSLSTLIFCFVAAARKKRTAAAPPAELIDKPLSFHA